VRLADIFGDSGMDKRVPADVTRIKLSIVAGEQ